jgi:hypothetical protein
MTIHSPSAKYVHDTRQIADAVLFNQEVASGSVSAPARYSS